MRSQTIEGAISPSDERLLDHLPEHEAGDYIFDGRFYQTVDETEYARRQDAVDSYIRNNALSDMGAGLYQQWVELDWKQPHGTYQAVERWKDKMQEEAFEEAPDALYEYARGHTSDSNVRRAAIEELGDVLWTTCALTSNAGQSINKGLQSYLWGDGRISHREERLTLGHLDRIIQEGFTPWFSPIDELDPPEEDMELIRLDEMEPRKNLILRTQILIMPCEDQFAPEADGFVLGWHQKIGKEKVVPRAADLVMLIAWYAHHFADSSLAEVVEANILKLRPRVAANLIDKSDGERSTLTDN